MKNIFKIFYQKFLNLFLPKVKNSNFNIKHYGTFYGGYDIVDDIKIENVISCGLGEEYVEGDTTTDNACVACESGVTYSDTDDKTTPCQSVTTDRECSDEEYLVAATVESDSSCEENVCNADSGNNKDYYQYSEGDFNTFTKVSDFTGTLSCETNYGEVSGESVTVTCPTNGENFVFSGCEEIVCTSPSDTTGYTTDETSLNISSGFDTPPINFDFTNKL